MRYVWEGWDQTFTLFSSVTTVVAYLRASPTARPLPEAAACATYIVKAGDTLSGIARDHGATLAEVLAVNPGISPDRIAVGQTVSIPGTPTPPGLIRVVTRDEWGAKAPRKGITKLGPVTALTVHHTATAVLPVNRTQGIAQARLVQAIHHGQGWADVGYHALLDQEGTFYTGRRMLSGADPFADGSQLALGSHVGRRNTGNVGVSVMGYFHAPHNHRISPAAIEALRTGLKRLLDLYSLNRTDVLMHREWAGAATVCPGDTLAPIVAQIRAEL